MIFGKIVKPAFKQSNDPISGMRPHSYPTTKTTAGSRFCRRFGPLLLLYHGQLNPLSIFKLNFCERFKNPILVEGFDGFCHGESQLMDHFA